MKSDVCHDIVIEWTPGNFKAAACINYRIQLLLQESQEPPQPKKTPASGHNPFLTGLTDFGIRSKGGTPLAGQFAAAQGTSHNQFDLLRAPYCIVRSHLENDKACAWAWLQRPARAWSWSSAQAWSRLC